MLDKSHLANKRILITGGLGFIGSNLAHACLECGMKVSIVDNLDSYSGGNLYNIEGIRGDVNLTIGNISDFDQVAKLVMSQEVIINCAASTSHPYSMREPWLNLDVNSRGVINLLEAIKRVNPQARFVHLGTTTQLGALESGCADETHCEFPKDIYSANKVVAEKYVLIYAKAHGLRATVLRFPNVFGPRAAIHSPEFTFNNFFVGLALQGKPITVFKPGDQRRNVLYVEDAVSAILLSAMSSDGIGQTYLATHDDHLSVREIAEATAQEIGGSVNLVDWPENRKSIEIGDAIFSNNKIKQDLGWSPTWSIQDGLKATKNYFSGEVVNKYFK